MNNLTIRRIFFCSLWLSLLLLSQTLGAVTHAQNATGTLASIIKEFPTGYGWNAVVAEAQAENSGNGHPLYHSTKLESQTFEGDYTPTVRTVLAIFSDDGSDVTVDGTKIWPHKGEGQGLPYLDQSLHRLNVTLEPNTTHHIIIDYSNTTYTGDGDIDGVTLFAYEKTAPYISLDTAQRAMVASYTSPNGIDPKNVKFIVDGIDQTANSTCSSSSISYTLPSNVSFFASHAVRVQVTDNDGNLAVASVSAHTFMPEDPFVDVSSSTNVSYNLLGMEQVRVRVCLWATDTTTKTFASSSQTAGEHSVTWNGLDDNGNRAQTGVYVFKVEKSVGTSWVDIADIDPINGRTIRLNIDGARLSDENTNTSTTPGGQERTTQFPVKIWATKTGSWTMVPLQLVGTTLLGTPVIKGQLDSTLDGYLFNDSHNVRPTGTNDQPGPPPDPDYIPGSTTLYWYIKDVINIRSLSTNASGQPMSYKLNASVVPDFTHSIPVVNITTGILGATVTQQSGQMAYRGVDRGTDPGAKIMAYTFDDGPYDNVTISTQNTSTPTGDRAITQELLDALSSYNVHATFFTNGTRIRATCDANTDILWSMVSAGHELADHTYSHISNINRIYYADAIRSEIIEDRLMERWVIGVKHNSTSGQPPVPYFRPPGGAGVGYADRTIIDQNFNGDLYNQPHYNDPFFWTTVGETGYMTIAWGPSPADPGEDNTTTMPGQAAKIVNYLQSPKGLHSGNIVLLHNGREHTVLALQQMLAYLQRNGWSLGKASDVQPVIADSNINATKP